MDSLTHIVLGACIGEAILENKIGKRAMLIGAIAQSVPDIDFIANFWLGPTEELLAHRGFTHSILFVLLITPLFAMFSERIHRPHNITLKRWLLFFGIEMFVHLFLDAFNNYGVGWFEPFSHARISFNAIYVADPFFSFFPGIAFIVLLVLNRQSKNRKIWWMSAIIFCTVYLGYSVINKLIIEREAKMAFTSQHIPDKNYFTSPAPLQNLLWMVVAGNDSGYYVGFRSLLDSKPDIHFQYFPRNDQYLDTISDHKEVANLVRFSKGFYTVEKWKDTLVFNDLRFGQMFGWDNPKGRFVFQYYLKHPENNEMVVQRGRFAGWNRKMFRIFINRIIGN